MSKLDTLIQELEELTSRAQNSREYSQLTESIPTLQGRTVFDALTSVPDIIIIEYPELYQVKKQLKQKFSKERNAFFNIEKSYVEKIISYLNLKKEDSAEVSTVYVEDETKDITPLMDYFESITSLIPDKYKKQVGAIDVYLSNNYSSSYASYDESKKSINLSMNSKEDIFISEVAHEYGHLLERFNSPLNKECLSFLNKRIIQIDPITISEAHHRIEHEDDSMHGNNDIMVYFGRFIDPYVGRIYGELKNSPATEIMSVGLQSLFLDPVVFLFKDVEHFKLIYNLLKGKY